MGGLFQNSFWEKPPKVQDNLEWALRSSPWRAVLVCLSSREMGRLCVMLLWCAITLLLVQSPAFRLFTPKLESSIPESSGLERSIPESSHPVHRGTRRSGG